MITLESIPAVAVDDPANRGVQSANTTSALANGDRSPPPPPSSMISHATWNSRTSFQPTRILVGIDFSEASESARRLALGIALACDAVVDLVHVFDAFRESFVHDNRDLLDRADELLVEVGQALVRRERMARAQGVRSVHTCLVGAPGLELACHAASTGADLIVLGDAHEEPGRFGWTWGRRAAEQLFHSSRWHGIILLRPAGPRWDGPAVGR